MKKITIQALCALLIVGSAFADTNVFLVNNTSKTITPHFIPVGTKNKDIYTFSMDPREIYKIVSGKADLNKGRPVAPGKKVKILRLNRNVGVKSGKNYIYQIKLDGPGMPKGNNAIVLEQKLYGKAIGSSAWFGITTLAKKATPTWIYEGDQFVNFGTKVGQPIVTVGGEWKAAGTYQDIVFTITDAGIVTPKNQLNLFQYNIQQRPAMEGLQAEATFGLSHSERSRLSTITLPTAVRKFDPTIDVVTVNEAFTKVLRPQLTENMRKNGFIYATQVLGTKGRALWSGGVMVFSKWPIERTAEYIFRNFASADKNADKGVLYAQINKNGKIYNIFATHTNASYDFTGKTRLPMNDKGRKSRAKQFVEMKNFINAQRIPSNQPVIIVGDMNVDMISEKGKTGDEYSNMIKSLNATHPPVSGHKFTLDKNTNEWVDKDDGPPQYLDYALYSNTHQKPTSATNTPICLKSNGKNICRKKPGGGVRDLSDHYPIQAKFTFPR